jgi:hypothetical protein
MNLPWILLVINLPGRHQALRMRLWRALKTAGASMLRDGVYLLPGRDAPRALCITLQKQIVDQGGTASLLSLPAQAAKIEAEFRAQFDRTSSYAALQSRLDKLRITLPRSSSTTARRSLQRLRRDVVAVSAIDFFPGPPRSPGRDQILAGLQAMEALVQSRFAPGEPRAGARALRQPVAPRKRNDYQGRTWATRKHPWVDRLASAWLIRRFIDRRARFVWLANPRSLPKGAIGYDFDGAEFTHTGQWVTFEVLQQAFELDSDAALRRIGTIVHFLDVGGVPIPDAAPVEAMLRQMRHRVRGDDGLLRASRQLFDDLYGGYRLQPARA